MPTTTTYLLTADGVPEQWVEHFDDDNNLIGAGGVDPADNPGSTILADEAAWDAAVVQYEADQEAARHSIEASKVEIMVSRSAHRTGAHPLDGEVLDKGKDYAVFVIDLLEGVDRIEFKVDGTGVNTESTWPYDLYATVGGPPGTGNRTDFSKGQHVIEAEIFMDAGGSHVRTATFDVED